MVERATVWDVIIVGGGPAGLSAALMLGRCRHRVLLFDSGHPRNAASRRIHGYLTRDGISPQQWLAIARKDVSGYDVIQRNDEVVKVIRTGSGFQVRTRRNAIHASKKVLLATGVVDHVPDIPGSAELYGTSVFHCPYCDGWEVRDRPLAAYGKRNRAVALALNLRTWSTDVMLFTDGPSQLNANEHERLQRAGITVITTRIAELIGTHGKLKAVRLAGGSEHARSALFFSNGHRAHCSIAADLGCRVNRLGEVITDIRQRTHIPGLYVAGDASIDVQFVSVAVAEGAKAAVAIHNELLDERDRA